MIPYTTPAGFASGTIQAAARSAQRGVPATAGALARFRRRVTRSPIAAIIPVAVAAP